MTFDQVLLPLTGGVMIGLAASLYLWSHGRVAGISGLYGGLFERHDGARPDRLAFVAGLVVTGLVLALAWPTAFGTSTVSLGLVAVAGLLVGVGTKLGSGCTSGHGVCGTSRLAPRSIVATLTFIAAGALTVVAVRQLGLS